MSSSHGAILFLTSWYPVSSNPTHGIFIRNHALALSQFQKVIVVYAYSSNEKPHYKIEENKVNDNLTEYTIRYTKPELSIRPFSSAIQLLKLKKAHRLIIADLKRKNELIKAIQVNVIFPVALVLDLYKQTFKTDYTILEHWSGYLPADGNYRGAALKRVTQSCVAGAKKIWHISQPQMQAMLAHGLKGNYELIYNAVNTSVFKPAAHKSNRIKLIHVSSLVEREKNISGTFKVLKALQTKGYDFDTIIVGGAGQELEDAKKTANNLQVKNIDFKGVQKPEAVAQLMQESTALILFSHYEGMPVVVLEALSCGLPVIATKVGQLPYMIKDEFGVLVEVKNETQMQEAIADVFANKYKFDSAAMRKFVEEHASYEAVGQQLSDYYTK